jgi:predicted transposase YbfD/YdcC
MAVRCHWRIARQPHWTLAAAFREDDGRVRVGHAPENVAVLRRIALHRLRQDQTVEAGRKAKRRAAGWNDAYRRRLLAP